MTPSTQGHPSAEKLHAFALGDLPPEELDEIERHVETCELCCGALRCIPDDTFVGRLKLADTAIIGDPQKHKAPVAVSKDIPGELQNHPRYHVTRWLGGGGMGAVFEANHRLMERVVAIKVINQAFMRNNTAIERFAVEVKAAAKLSHPNIVSAFDADRAGELHFLVMEHVAGRNLAEHVAQHGRLDPANACDYARQIARGLQHAHERSMIHRDIKPKNLMLTDQGTVKILDFGLARFAREPEADSVATSQETGITAAGVAIGTPDYLSPEQIINAKQADIRSDIYSLGCTLYFLLSGQPPFPGGSNIEKLSAHLERTAQPLDELRDDLPTGLVAVVNRMMHRDPARRFQTPAEVAAALEPFTKDTLRPAITPHAPGVKAKKTARPKRGYPSAARYWLPLVGVAAILVVAVGLLFSGTRGGVSPEQRGNWKLIGGDLGSIDIDTGGETDTISIEPVDDTTLCGDGKGPCLYRELSGNFMVTTEVRTFSKTNPRLPPEHVRNLAGLFVSDQMVAVPNRPEDEKRYKILLVGTLTYGQRNVQFLDSDNGLDHPQNEPGFESGELRVARVDGTFYVLSKSTNDQQWSQIQSVPYHDQPVRVGLVAGAYKSEADLKAVFSNVRVKTIDDPRELLN